MRLKALAVLALGALVMLGVLMSRPSGPEGRRVARVGQPAPEITGKPWINSEPLSLAKLRGRVVFLEFWTYG